MQLRVVSSCESSQIVDLVQGHYGLLSANLVVGMFVYTMPLSNSFFGLLRII